MFKGFYNLTSGMLTQQRNLNIIAENMVNISTPGFKGTRFTASTFDDVLYNMVGNKNKDYQPIGNQSYILAPSMVYTDFDQGTTEPTGLSLDFAIEGEGFFAVKNEAGETVYTRNGSFGLDEEGYLVLPGEGRVLDQNGSEIQLNTDKVNSDNTGRIFSESGNLLGQVGVYTFEDPSALTRNDQGFFTGGEGQAAEAPLVHAGYVERSNVDMVKQMTEMMTSQRALQSAAQLSKMYDQLMNKATSDVGRM